MAKSISTKFSVEGESAYKSAIKNIDAEMRVLKSEMAVVSAEFANQANSIDALTSKNNVLSSMYDTQVKKVEQTASALEAAQAAFDNITKEIEEKSKALADAEKLMEEYKSSTDDTTEAETQLQAEIEKLQKELATAETAQGKAATSVENWTKKANYAEAQAYKFKNEIDDNNKKLEIAENQMNSAGDAAEQLGDDFQDVEKSATDMGNQSAEAFTALASVLAASGVAQAVDKIKDELIECYDAAMKFNSGVAQIYTLVPGTSDEIKKMTTDSLVQFKTEFGVSGEVATKAMYDTVSATGDLDVALDYLNVGQKSAVGGATDLATAMDGITTVVNAYGPEMMNAGKASDIMFTSVKQGKTTFSELSSSLFNVIPIAAANKIAFEDVAGAIATMTLQGTPTATATTQIKQALTELTDGGTEVAQTFEKITNKSFNQFIAEGGNLQEAFEMIDEYADDASLGMNELFSSTEAASTAMMLSGENGKKYASVLEEMESSAGATEEAYNAMAETSEYSSQKFASSVETMQIAVGNVLEPALQEMQENGADAFTWAAELVEENPWIVSAMTAIGVSIGIITVGVGALTAATAASTPVIAAFNATLAANPIGLAAVAIAGLIAGLVALTSTMENSNQELDDAKASAEATTTAINALSDATKTSVEETNMNATTAGTLVEMLARLESQGLNTATATGNYANVVAELNELMPELNLSIDENTGLIDRNIETLEEQIELQKEQEIAAIYLEEVVEATELLAEAEHDLMENTEEYNEVSGERNEILREQQEVADQLANTNGLTQEQIEELVMKEKDLGWQLDEINTSYYEQLAVYEQYNSAVTSAQEKVDAATESHTAYQEKLTKEEELIAAQAESYNDMIARYDSLALEISELEQAYTDQYIAAYDNISGTIGLFNEMDNESKTSVESMISTFDSQIEYMSRYSDNFATVMARAGNSMPDEFVTKLSDGSEESAEILAGLADASDEDFATIVEKMKSVEEGKTAFSEEIAETATNFEEESERIKGEMDSLVDELDMQSEAAYNTSMTIQGIVNTAYNKQGSVAAAYANLANVANQAYQARLQIHSPSKEFEQNTMFTIEAVVNTTAKGEQDVKDAYTDLAKTAIDSYSLSIDDGMASETEKTIEYESKINQSVSSYFEQENGKISIALDGDSISAINKMVEKIEQLGDTIDLSSVASTVGTAVKEGLEKTTINTTATISAKDTGKAVAKTVDGIQGQDIKKKRRGVTA